MGDTRFVGHWNLLSYELESTDDRSVTLPLGKEPVGTLMYTDDGRMYGALMKKDRAAFSTNDFMKGTISERAGAMDSFVAYCGTYEIQDERVIHHVKISWYPNWTGKRQERFYQFDGNKMSLSTRPFRLDGKEQVARLVWEKSSS